MVRRMVRMVDVLLFGFLFITTYNNYALLMFSFSYSLTRPPETVSQLKCENILFTLYRYYIRDKYLRCPFVPVRFGYNAVKVLTRTAKFIHLFQNKET